MNSELVRIIRKKSRLVIGLLSGTSIDGIDAVLVKIEGNGKNTKIKIIDFITRPFPEKVRTAILKNSAAGTAKLDEVCRLNVILGALFSDAVLILLRRNRKYSNHIDLIGSHGQTVRHLPERKNFLGYKVKSTLQIADPAVIANLTGITTVGDFRIAECAFDGDGAPLVPYMDYILFTHKTRSRALVNIGGIANITVLPKNAGKDDVIAFDTGPGNMLIDGIVNILFKVKYDKNGMIAGKGKVDRDLFSYLKSDKYIKRMPPKSTGREHYGHNYLKKLLGKTKRLNKHDIVRTVTEFTSYSIWFNYSKFVKDKTEAHELIVSGGGAENPVLMKSLKNYFRGVKVRKMNDYGLTASNKESVLFAILANECISGIPANLRNVTGSARDVVLGKICLTNRI